jgi:hypothetical protein
LVGDGRGKREQSDKDHVEEVTVLECHQPDHQITIEQRNASFLLEDRNI